MSDRLVYFNGEYVPEREARVSIFDSALMFGDMAFEMTRTFAGRPFCLRDHLDRLYMSLRLLEIDCGLSIDQMEQATLDTLARNAPTEAADVDWQIMHDVSRGPLPGYATVFAESLRPTVSINCWPLLPMLGRFAATYEQGMSVVIPVQQAVPAHLIDPKAKTRSRQHYQMAILQAARMGAGSQPLMTDGDGYLAEGPGWNFFIVKDGALLTSEPRNILLGVSRKVTMQFARELGLEVHETNLGRYEGLEADEMFITSTPFCLVHAASFEGRNFGDGRPGPVFRRLTEAWKKHVGLDFVAQAASYTGRVEAWEQEQTGASVAG
jgi:branched-chain amino acid aminotransferase